MVYLPAHTFTHILSYCDDRVEQNQRIHLAKCLAVLKHLKFLATSKFEYLDTKRINILDGFIPGNTEQPLRGLVSRCTRNEDINFNLPETYPFLDLFMDTAQLFLRDELRDEYHAELLYCVLGGSWEDPWLS